MSQPLSLPLAVALFFLSTQQVSALGGEASTDCNVCTCKFIRKDFPYTFRHYVNYTVPGASFTSDSQCNTWCETNHPVKQFAYPCVSTHKGGKCASACPGDGINATACTSEPSDPFKCYKYYSGCPFTFDSGVRSVRCTDCYKCLCKTTMGTVVRATEHIATPSLCQKACDVGAGLNGTVTLNTSGGCRYEGHRVGECLGNPSCSESCTYSHGGCGGGLPCGGVYCTCPVESAIPMPGCGL